jgi:hypothetical protein
MNVFLTDKEIEALIDAEKRIEVSISQFTSKFKDKRGHREYDLVIERPDNSAFKIIIRQGIENPLDFSVILGFIPAGKNEVFRLRRYNGKSHFHSNRLEGDQAFYDFHIHTASERYQREGMKEEHYAEITERYADIHGAIDCMVSDCRIISNDPQQSLFGRSE